ncbi:MAG: transketolase [Magnetococcales bacterium]|nr:transketolase [Magnetococcales bacterium]
MIDPEQTLEPLFPNSPPLDSRSADLRRLVLRAMEGGGRGHPGPALSLIEILRVLYDDILLYKANKPDWKKRDRCILSKGHGCLALYALLADKGFFPVEALDEFCHFNAILGGHPERGKIPGVEASTGALGHGLSIGVGQALAAKLQKQAFRSVVVMGDGEINEGSVWEAALTAAKHRLDNLIAIIDYNKLQSYGTTRQVLNMEPMTDKWAAFGFTVHQVDGHDVEALRTTLKTPPVPGKPTAIICHTIKGKGLPPAENNPAWHHQSRMAPEQFSELYQALEVK